MSLDPSNPSWIGVLAAIGVVIWIVAIGVPLAHATFRARSRLVWPYYAPIVGIVVVLLTTNVVAYAVPGATAAWIGLIAPSAASAVVAWRSVAGGRITRRSVLSVLALTIASAGVFVFALANRTQVWFVDEAWHFPLAIRIGRGVFPPVTPYGPDAGIGYHYGPDLLAATTISTTGTPPWTTFYVLMSFLVVALILVTAGFAYDVGTPLPLAVGIGAVVAFFAGELDLGLPRFIDSPEHGNGAARFLAGLGVPASAHPSARLGFT